MHSISNLPIMPKEPKTLVSAHPATISPYPMSTTTAPRSAAIWSAADDEILIQARSSGLNWLPIAKRHFPNKTPNACRKRHERLIEKRQVEDWDAQKLEMLAQEYLAVRKEMWEVLAARVGERWSVVEAKCMEKGLKNLQSAARSSQRRAAPDGRNGSFDDQGIPIDRNSDSGIGIGSGSDAEMEVDDQPGRQHTRGSSSWHASQSSEQPQHQEHNRSRSLPQPLPLYQPPPPLNTSQRRTLDGPMSVSPMTYSRPPLEYRRYSPEFQNGRGGISIQAMLSPADPLR